MQDKSNRSTQELSDVHFVRFENYQCNITDKLNVCHVIESLGLGGGQTMMMELIRGLDKYYDGKILNLIVCPRPSHQKFDKNLYASYGVSPITMREKDLRKFLSSHNVHIVLQHRLAVSKCLKPLLLNSVKYIMMNHTYHQLNRIPNFLKCDYYISVCNYLNNETKWPSYIHSTRRGVILNGVENDYITEIEPEPLGGEFKTGRCHRLVQSKFKVDSIAWIDGKVAKNIPGHQHYMIGTHNEAKKLCKRSKSCNYVGAITDRSKKMSILKALDLYFYETFSHEGASIAILESLACGVPVICKNYGGNSELITDGVNGYIVKDRNDFLLRMKELSTDPDKLEKLKESTRDDFEKRLHVKQTAARYMQLFEAILKT
ncbi:MAG: glycosyltransferase family 4 protein [Promethearchaeota archaeon]